MPDRPYVRVYYNDLIRDYPEVWADDAQLSCWLRLLATADPMWPTPPELPRSAKARPLASLVKSSLVSLLPMHRFRLKGMDGERNARSNAARIAAAKRWQNESNAPTMPSRAEPSNAEAESEPRLDAPTSREGLPNLDQAAIRELERRTGRTWGQAGGKQLSEYDELIETHGLEKVLSAMDRIADGTPMTARQLVWGAMKVLEPMIPVSALLKEDAETERQEERDRNSRRGVEATQRYLAELRSVGAPKESA